MESVATCAREASGPTFRPPSCKKSGFGGGFPDEVVPPHTSETSLGHTCAGTCEHRTTSHHAPETALAQLHMQKSKASAPFDGGKQATTCGKSKRTHEKEDRRMRTRVITARMQWARKWVRERMQGSGGGAAHRLLFRALAQDLQIVQSARSEVFKTCPPPCPNHLHEWSKGLACLTCCGASHTGLQGVAQGFCRAAVRWVCMCAVHGHARKRSRQGREHT